MKKKDAPKVEKKDADKKTQERLAWLASFPNLDPNPVIEINSTGEITYVNLAARVEFPDLTTLGRKHQLVKGMLSTTDKFKMGRNEYAMVEKIINGGVYELHCSFIPDTQDIRAYVLDATERRRSEELKNEFLRTVSHELRTPISITKTGIEFVLDEIAGKINEKQKKVLNVAKQSMDRLARLIDDLLDISKIEAGRVRIRKEEIDLTALVMQLASSFELKMKERGLKLEVNVPEGGIKVFADPDRIIQVFTNLLGNALKFTEKGSITVFIHDKNDRVECSVIDTGIGIPEEELPEIFDKFRQVGRTPGTGEKGTGLGLSIAKGIVELHKGKLWAESEFGKGTKFVFTVPKYTADAVLKEELDREIEEAVSRNSKVSLIKLSPNIHKNVSHDWISGITKRLGDVVKQNLRRAGDAAFIDSRAVAVLLADCDKVGAVEVGSRLEKAINDYISDNKLGGQISLRLENATYPDDAGDGEGLIKKVHDGCPST